MHTPQPQWQPEKTRAKFYLLPHSGLIERIAFCAELIHSQLQTLQTLIVVDSPADATEVDQKLWTFCVESFLPHAVVTCEDAALSSLPQFKIWINHEPMILFNQKIDVLINLSTMVPVCAPNAQSIIELVSEDESSKALSRQHYKQYKKAGIAIETEMVTANQEN